MAHVYHVAWLLSALALVFLVVGVCVAFLLRQKNCASWLRQPVVFLGFTGTVQRFRYASADYAKRFASANEKKLVNISRKLRQAMEG